jgi:rhodanese-related sulfurtransferase
VRIPTAPGVAAGSLQRPFDSLAAAQAAGYTVIDIREPREVAEEPLPGSGVQLLPMQQLLRADARLAKNAHYLLVCASGRRSLAAAQTLHERGFTDVVSLSGGLSGLLAQHQSA